MFLRERHPLPRGVCWKVGLACSTAVFAALWHSPPLCCASIQTNYHVLAIANDADSGKNDLFVSALQKFTNFQNLAVYRGAAGEDMKSPIWVLDNKDGAGITKAFVDFRANHTVGSCDVFIFYYAGHSTQKDDDDADDETDKQDEAFFKEGSESVFLDDDLATRIGEIGASDDDKGVQTLRLAILDTCCAKGYWTGKNDLGSVPGAAIMYATEEDEMAYTTKCVNAIRDKANDTLKELDKGLTDDQSVYDGWTEPANNKKVTWEEWFYWSRNNLTHHELPAYAGGTMYEKTWRKPVLIPEPSSVLVWSLLGVFGIIVGWYRRRNAA